MAADRDAYSSAVRAALEGLSGPDRVRAERLLDMAGAVSRATFGPFNDLPESEFYEAPALTPEQTWEAIAEQVAHACALALLWGLNGEEITAHRIALVHEIIFGTTFPAVAGRIRRAGEEVTYGIVLGLAEKPTMKIQRGTSSRQLQRKLDVVCKDFNRSALVEDRRGEAVLEELIETAAKLYVKILSAHPFPDGNGRTAYVLLQYALVRLGLVAVALDDFRAHQLALGYALRVDGKQSYRQLVALIADTIRTAASAASD